MSEEQPLEWHKSSKKPTPNSNEDNNKKPSVWQKIKKQVSDMIENRRLRKEYKARVKKMKEQDPFIYK